MDTDTELVARAREGDRAAFEDLVRRHEGLLRALCLRMAGTKGLAEDAVQEAVVQAMLDLDSLRQPDRFGSWLAGIGLNVCRHLLRAEHAADVSLDPVGGVVGVWPVDASDPQQVAEESELAQAVRSLGPLHRAGGRPRVRPQPLQKGKRVYVPCDTS